MTALWMPMLINSVGAKNWVFMKKPKQKAEKSSEMLTSPAKTITCTAGPAGNVGTSIPLPNLTCSERLIITTQQKKVRN